MPRPLIGLVLAVALGPRTLAAQTIIGPGDHPELTIGADGLGLAAYVDSVRLKVAHCSDLACAAFTTIDLDDADGVGGVLTDPAGRPVILYAWAGNVRVVRCADAVCSTGSFSTVAAGKPTGITIGGDGLPLIAIDAAGVPTVAHCDDAACSTATVTAHPQAWAMPIGRLIVGENGLGFSVLQGGLSIYVLRCLDVACLSADVALLEQTPQGYPFGPAQGLVRGGDGHPLLSQFIAQDCDTQDCLFHYYVSHCADAACSAIDERSVLDIIDFGDPGWNDSLDVDAYGLGTVAYGSTAPMAPSPKLVVRRCMDLACSALTPGIILDQGSVTWCSLRNEAGGYPLVAYVRQGEVRVARANLPSGLADLSVIQADGVTSVLPGERLTYTIVASNAGPDAVTSALLQDVLPSELVDGVWTCSASPGSTCVPTAGAGSVNVTLSLPSGGSATVTLAVTVDGAATSPVSNTVSISVPAGFPDPQLGNNSATDVDALAGGPVSLSIADMMVVEGNSGLTQAAFPLALSRPSAQTVSVNWATIPGGTATPGADYVAGSGTAVIAPGETSGSVVASVVGDTVIENDETFLVAISGPVGAVIAQAQATGTIADDDAPSLSSDELTHGSSQGGDLRAQPGPVADRDYFRLAQPPRSSWEVAVDGTSGDVAPVILERLAADNIGVLQTAAGSSAGGSASLRWENPLPGVVTNQHLAVRSGGCTTTCDASAVYRIRAWETTINLARFNNSSTQVTVLVLANPGARSVSGTVWYWSVAGGLLASEPFNLAPRATLVRNTSLVPAASAVAGSITVTHNGGYGALAGKAVSIEPATGFTFDTPLLARPR
jgi:uncharacterized repeat protein (TIGR01451 family)